MVQRIVMVAYTGYSNDSRVRREAETLASMSGKNVMVLTNKASEIPKPYRLQGVEIWELNQKKYQGTSTVKYILSYLYFTMLAFIKFTELVIKNEVDIVHVHNMPNFLIYSAIVPYLSGRKIILDIHDTMVETYGAKFSGRKYGFISWILRVEERISCMLATNIISVNQAQKMALVKRGIPESKIIIVMNIPDPKYFYRYTKENWNYASAGEFRMVYHGTVTERLGIDLAIRAVARLKNEIPGFRFHIIGSGDKWNEYIFLAKKLGVEEHVIFRGLVPLEELAQILNEMDIGVVPNRRSEASELMLPVKLMEYVALGIPVVIPRLTAVRLYFSEEMGFYFEPDDIESLVCAIRSAYSKTEEREQKSRKAIAFIAEYGWETHKKDFLELYKKNSLAWRTSSQSI